MKQTAFEATYQSLWQEFDKLLDDLDRRKPELSTTERNRLPSLYRRICGHYALAQQRHYSPHLVEALHRRVLRGHQHLYRSQSSFWWRLVEFIWSGFPTKLRQNSRYFWVGTALFYLPALVFGTACFFDGDMIYSVMPDLSVSQMEYMYDPDNRHLGRDPEDADASSFMMFGYYIYNNISIGFRTFALGLLAAIGTVFITLYNGVVIGGVAGHLSQLGFTSTFWPFVSGHGAFELTAITICSAAGLKIGQPLLAPGRYRRLDALKIAAKDAVQLVAGAALMLVIAAVIEAFWSGSASQSIATKFVAAGFFWLLVILYLSCAGRTPMRKGMHRRGMHRGTRRGAQQ